MAYVVSKNLKHTLKLKNHMYLLVSDAVAPQHENYFCGECRTMFRVKRASSVVCPNCGFTSKHCQNIYSFDDEYRIDDIIDSVTFNKSLNDDGSVKDINVTILCHSYKISCNTKQRISWQYYHRILFNFETKQIYYTYKPLLSKNVEFQHFKLHLEWATDASKFSFFIPRVVKEIYDTYGIVCLNHNTWYHAIPKNMKSATIAFMCLKFPIMMNFTYDLWTGYPRRLNCYGMVDIHISMIYWACNYDPVLKRALMSITEQEYIERTDEIMHKMTNDEMVIESVRKNPLYVVYARYMYQLGFRCFHSVEQIVNYVSQTDVHKRCMPVWIFDILCKRMHTRNKMYRRLLKICSEERILTDLFCSDIRCTYKDFFNSSYYRGRMNKFYASLESQMNDADFFHVYTCNIFNGICDQY